MDALVSLRPDDLTWDRALRLFALRCRSQNLTAATQKLYTINLRTWCRWLAANGDPQPPAILAEHLRAYLEQLRARGLKDSTVDCNFRILRALWGFLERDGLLLINPMRRVERPKRERRLVKAFTPEQVRLLLGAINTRRPLGLRDFALCVLLADTGLRASEALSLRVADLDLAQCVLTVIGKGRKERVVPFGQTARRALLDWLKTRGDLPGMDALWCNRFGGTLAKQTIGERLRGYGRKAGLSDTRCSMHTFRHFFAVAYLRNGGDVLTLQKILGPLHTGDDAHLRTARRYGRHRAPPASEPAGQTRTAPERAQARCLPSPHDAQRRATTHFFHGAGHAWTWGKRSWRILGPVGRTNFPSIGREETNMTKTKAVATARSPSERAARSGAWPSGRPPVRRY